MIQYRTSPTVELVRADASDLQVAKAAWVSTMGSAADNAEPSRIEGLINYLVKHRHGSPFEHTSFTFLVECPIFVAREIMRHRTLSFNEVSGRYAKLEPVFWMPGDDRGLVNQGTSARPVMGDPDPDKTGLVRLEIQQVCDLAWEAYEAMLKQSIAPEVARTVLPTGIYTSMYVTGNVRALLHFVSLRVADPGNTYVTYPQTEIQEVAQLVAEQIKRLMPFTWKAFVNNGRVGP